MSFIPRRRHGAADDFDDEPREEPVVPDESGLLVDPEDTQSGASPFTDWEEEDSELDLPDQPAAAEEPEPVHPGMAAAAPQGVRVVREPAVDDPNDEYQWHTGLHRSTDRPDAVEFIETHKSFGRNEILKGLNMGLPEGMISMILGPSGTGKSVCIKHMVGLLYPDGGDVLVHGESVPSMTLDNLLAMRRKFGVLFQDGALFGSMNIFDNTAFPLRQHTDKSEDDVRAIVERRLGEVGLADAHEMAPNELSGGMRKRAGFARALVLDPSIVLFDEPDSGLDPVRTALLGELIKEIHAETMEAATASQQEHMPAFTIITHDIMTARRVSQYINVLWRGRIVEAGPAEDLFNSDNAFVSQFLAGSARGPLGMN